MNLQRGIGYAEATIDLPFEFENWAVIALGCIPNKVLRFISYTPLMADIQRARQLRKDETWAEKLMWRWLRDRRFSRYKFRRQTS